MRVAFVAAALAVLVALALALLVAANVRTLVAAQREGLVARLGEALGRPLTVAAVEPSLWPPGARLAGVVVVNGAGEGRVPLFEADAIVVRVRLWPLLRGRVEAGGIVLERPRVTLVRDARGGWNLAGIGDRERPARGAGDGPHEAGRRGPRVPAGWALGIAVSEIRDGTLVLDDARDGRPRRLVVRHVAGRARNVRLGGSARLRLAATVFGEGVQPDTRLDLRIAHLGEHDLDATPFELAAEARAVDLAVLGAVLGPPWPRAGRVEEVTITARGTLAQHTAIVEVATGDAWAGPWVSGLPPVRGQLRLERRDDAVALPEIHATVGTLALAGHGALGADHRRLRVRFASLPGDALPITVAGTALAVTEVAGTLELEPQGARLTAGRLVADGMTLAITGSVAGGDRAALEVEVSGDAFGGTLEGGVRASTATGAAEVRAHVEAADAAALAARLAPEVADRVSGLATGSVVVTTRRGARGERATTGRGVVTVVDAQLRDVNLADRLLGRLDVVPFLPRLLRREARERHPAIFAVPDTVVDQVTIPFAIADGRLSSRRFTASGGPYDVVGRGWIDARLALRVHGNLRLGRAVSAALRKDVPALRHLQGNDGRVTVPFRVRGRLGDAEPELDLDRLRARGLEILREKRARDRPEGKPGGRSEGERGIEDEILDRLERMIAP